MARKRFRQGKRRVMKEFQIDELASVDHPAQEPARALILKRKGDPDYDPDNPDKSKRGRALITNVPPGSMMKSPPLSELTVVKSPFDDETVAVLTGSNEGHQHLVWLGHGRAGLTSDQVSEGADRQHDHPWMMNPDGTVTIGDSEGHGHTVDSAMVMQAVMSLAKRQFSADERERLAESGAALSDGSFPIVTKADLRNAIAAFGRAAEGDRRKVANHIKRRANALDAADLLPEEGVLADLLKVVTAGDGATKEAEMPDNKDAASIEAVQKENEELRKELDALKAAAEPTPEPTPEPEVEKVDESIVYTADDGTEYTKADDPRFIELAKQRDEDKREILKLRARETQAGFEKRATEELPHLPGDIKVRAAILKALETIEDEDVRKAALESVAAGNASMKAAFDSVGHSDGSKDVNSAEAELEGLAKSYQKEHPEVNFYDAYEKVSSANPELTAKAIRGN